MRRRRLAPDTDGALGGLGCIFFAVLLAFGLAAFQAATVPQGFAP